MINKNVIITNSYSVVMPKYNYLNVKETLIRTNKLLLDTEYETVKRGLRDVTRVHLTPTDYDKQIDKINRDGLIFLPINRIKPFNGFSHTMNLSEENDPNFLTFGVVAKDLDLAKTFVKYSRENNDIEIGKMLGYPECCQKSFTEFWKTSFDPVKEIAKNTEGNKVCNNGNIIINNANSKLYIHLRYFGLRIIPWFPCSFNCEESSCLAEKWFGVMKELDSQTCNDLLKLISMSSKWSLINAQIMVEHPQFLGRSISYYDDQPKNVIFNMFDEID